MASEPVFVKVRNDEGEVYSSYDVIWQLIAWNFPSCELDEVEPMSSHTYIFIPTNGNVQACCERPHQARYIHWNIEIPKGDDTDKVDPWFDETWVSCRYFQQQLGGKTKFVVLGGDPRLVKEPDPEKQWDFCHLAYLYGKRARQVAELEAQGYKMAPVGWGQVRDMAIAKSRWGLCLHQNPVPALSPQRMTLFACRKLPIVLERANPEPYQVVMLDEFNPTTDLKDMVESNFQLFTQEYAFKKMVEASL